jgi:glutamate formiminotransferase
VECVPNFSEGRDADKVDAIAAAVRAVAGAVLLDRHMDGDHNRSVLTFAGPPQAVAEAALEAVGQAVSLIDLNHHTGVHPRIGAADVVPFIPVEGLTIEDCASIARQVGEEIWKRFGVPVYLYQAAALRPDRVRLEDVRRGQFEALREEVQSNPDRLPDFGEARLHPTAGATAVGARKFLIAYNINLDTPDVEVARKIARTVRHSSGGFPYVKAMGVPLVSRGLAQVSINLTDYEQTPVDCVFEAVETEAARYGAKIASSEIVGLVPRKAFDMAPEFYMRAANFSDEVLLENRLAALESE